MKVLLVGFKGVMGENVLRVIEKTEGIECPIGYDVGGFKLLHDGESEPKPEDFEDIDVIIDFSRPEATIEILRHTALRYSIPMVIATTGFTEEEQHEIAMWAEEIPIFESKNMSYEVKLMCDVARFLAPKLAGNFDIEILETHHRRKADAPSGTALAIAAAANEELNYTIIHNRSGRREKEEIGISDMRGGDVVGEHTLCFFGDYDKIEIKHTAFSREMFALGALKAAEFLVSKNGKVRESEEGECKIYSMDDL